jgi:hypothetical protein
MDDPRYSLRASFSAYTEQQGGFNNCWDGGAALPADSETPEMIVKLTPASEDRRVWMVSISPDERHAVPIDFMTAPQEQRPFLGEETAYFEAEPSAEGWEIKSRLERQSW